MQKNLVSDPTIEMILASEDVVTEEELQEKLLGDSWSIVKCQVCNTEYDLMKCCTFAGNPVCPVCGN